MERYEPLIGEHRVYIVDDDDSFRASLTRLLSTAGMSPIPCRSVGDYLLVEHPDCPSCIVLDMLMPGPSGLELLASLAHQRDAPPVIFVTAFNDIPATVQAMKAGAMDSLTKPLDMERLLQSLQDAIARDARNRAARRELEQVQSRYSELTPCERDIYIGVVHGKLNKQMALKLGICERSIKSHRSNVMRKMRVSSVAGLVKTAKLLDVLSGTRDTQAVSQ
nr:response regulator [uncultured Steroidobacter sp.]